MLGLEDYIDGGMWFRNIYNKTVAELVELPIKGFAKKSKKRPKIKEKAIVFSLFLFTSILFVV